MTILGADARFFRRQVWRKKPHVFRSAIDVSQYNLSAETICNLTGHDLVESRMVDSDSYSLQLGPFELAKNPGQDGLLPGLLPDLLPANQMLMVQCLEQHLEEVDSLLSTHFQFLPRWQVDDVMGSLGYAGVSCGPHFDQYDVFLIQYRGEKEWRLDMGDHQDSELRNDTDVRVLSRFEMHETLILGEGDVLYVPPGVGHWGICQGESITLSVGIRNPTMTEFLADLSEFLLTDQDSLPLDQALHLPGAGIPIASIEPLHSQVLELLSHKSSLLEWYGTFVTRLREPELVQPIDFPLDSTANNSSNNSSTQVNSRMVSCQVSLPSRLSYAILEDTVYLFANGESYQLPEENFAWIVRLVTKRALEIDSAALPGVARQLIELLILDGVLIAT
jgi:50S ribosomal protein L16 3-hydroxylase